VLGISFDSGPFQDFVSAGGGFIEYNGTISSDTGNPIGGRQGFVGHAGLGHPGLFAAAAPLLPPAAAGKPTRLRWRLVTDHSVASSGWSVGGFSVWRTGPILSN